MLKVCKEIKRYQETTIAQLSQRMLPCLTSIRQIYMLTYAASPMTPEGLEISLNTPAPLPMRFLWPTSLPWSRFQDIFPLGKSYNR